MYGKWGQAWQRPEHVGKSSRCFTGFLDLKLWQQLALLRPLTPGRIWGLRRRRTSGCGGRHCSPLDGCLATTHASLREQDTITYSSAISACEKFARNTITYSSAISMCEKAAGWVAAYSALGGGTTGLASNTITYSSAISACEKGVRDGLGAWGRGSARNTVTYCSAISTCEKGR